jgi:hypothetical protein
MPQETWVLDKQTLPNDVLTNNVGNLCMFSCPLCSSNNIYPSWKHVKKHYDRFHPPTSLDFNKDFLLEARYHKCILCSKIVLCDVHAFISHLKDHQKIPFKSYVKLVEMTGGRYLPCMSETNHKTVECIVKPCFVRLQKLSILLN